jgi:hypothetical protein
MEKLGWKDGRWFATKMAWWGLKNRKDIENIIKI